MVHGRGAPARLCYTPVIKSACVFSTSPPRRRAPHPVDLRRSSAMPHVSISSAGADNPAALRGAPSVRPVHSAVAGRARFRVDRLYRNEALGNLIEREAAKQPRVRGASARPMTGSVVVFFDPELRIEEVTTLLERIAAAAGEGAPAARFRTASARAPSSQSPAPGPAEPWHTLTADHVLAFWGDCSGQRPIDRRGEETIGRQRWRRRARSSCATA
jgi:hypothetical protein